MRPASPRSWLRASLLAAGIVVSTSAGAAPDDTPAPEAADFDPAAESWNGLHYLAFTAREAKVELAVPEALDWADVTPDDVLVIVAPDRGELAANARAFVEDGGGVLLAVDVGGAPELPAAFGVLVDDQQPPNERYFREHPAFPALLPPRCPEGGPPPCRNQPPLGWPFASGQDSHFLWFNVAEIVLNHPVGLRPLDPAPPDTTVAPVLRYAAGGTDGGAGALLVVEVHVGRGQALVVGDASLFIDDMQRNAYGDKQFAANTLRWFCGAGPCRATLITPKTRVTGTYVQRHGQRLFGLEGILTKGLEAVNDGVSEVNSAAETPTAQAVFAFGLVLLIVLACLGLPWPETRSRLPWQLRSATAPPMETYWAAALAAARHGADFSGPALGLEARLLRALARISSEIGSRLPTAEADRLRLVEAVRSMAGDGPALATDRSVLALVRINMATTAGSDLLSPPFSLEELEALWTDTTLVEQALPPRRP